MEFEDVSEQMEWEARRVAAAFSIKSFEHKRVRTNLKCKGQLAEIVVEWETDTRDGTLDFIRISHFDNETNYEEECYVSFSDYWNPTDTIIYVGKDLRNLPLDELMARGLYLLGFDTPDVVTDLAELTAHEKLELRSSMPREFWPKTWLEVEGE